MCQSCRATRSPRPRPQGPIPFKEETVSLCPPASASFDSQNVLFEMYCPQGPTLSGGQGAPTILRIGLPGSSMVGGLASTLFSRHIRLCIAIANRVLRRLAFFCCGLCSLRTARSKKPPANYRRVPSNPAWGAGNESTSRAVRSPEELRKGCSWVPLM